MPYNSYLQDLSQLIEDPLDQFSDTKSTLFDDSHHDPTVPCTTDLTPNTLQVMLELDKAEEQKNEADKATHVHSPTTDSEREQANSGSAPAHVLSSPLVFNCPPTTMTPRIVANLAVWDGAATSTASSVLREELVTEYATPIAVPPSLYPSPIQIVQADRLQSIDNMSRPACPSTPATALTTRNTDQVIADLKKFSTFRPIASSFSSKHRLTSYASTKTKSTTSDLPKALIHPSANASLNPDDEGYEDESIKSSDEEEAQPVSRPRKITERKRRDNAIVDSYMQKRSQKQLKEDHKVRSEDEAQQSARLLVNHSENREIISSPREYQVELFEKAKEKNIIAVLDTGMRLPAQFSSLVLTS
jgi:endoribonuclease Dicer